MLCSLNGKLPFLDGTIGQNLDWKPSDCSVWIPWDVWGSDFSVHRQPFLDDPRLRLNVNQTHYIFNVGFPLELDIIKDFLGERCFNDDG